MNWCEAANRYMRWALPHMDDEGAFLTDLAVDVGTIRDNMRADDRYLFVVTKSGTYATKQVVSAQNYASFVGKGLVGGAFAIIRGEEFDQYYVKAYNWDELFALGETIVA